MHYPINITDTGTGIHLLLPAPEKIKQVYERLVMANPNTPFPFWARVWASSIAMTHYLQTHPKMIKGKKILEIGAGTGLPSFSIARSAASVIISDHAVDAVELMEKNIAYLELDNATAICLDWNRFPDDIQAEVILLSDINYAPEAFCALHKLIERFLAANATVIITTPHRITGASFALQLAPFIESKAELMVEDTPISLFVLSKKN